MLFKSSRETLEAVLRLSCFALLLEVGEAKAWRTLAHGPLLPGLRIHLVTLQSVKGGSFPPSGNPDKGKFSSYVCHFYSPM